ncbi:hypothetical protein FS837_009843 [Tulasnella sp. UAMH 9824]|nr:hypothetical protein FS837_009843 [Tulasnella sp. UAMH 9824]
MFSKLFNRRRSTTTSTPPLQLGPTYGQPTARKPESSFVKKLKTIKKAISPRKLGKKEGNRPSHSHKGSHISDSSDESFGNLAPGPFTAEDYEFRRPAPIPTHQNLVPHPLAINVPLPSRAPSTARLACPKSVSVNPSSTPLPTTLETLANALLKPQQPVSTSQVEAEALAIRRCLADLSAIEPVVRGEAQELRAIRIRRAASPGGRTPSFTQRHGSETAEEKLLPAAKAHSKAEKQRKEAQNKWWEMESDLRDTKRHIRKEAIDYGNPTIQPLNLEGLGSQTDAKNGALELPKVRNPAATTSCSPHDKENAEPATEQACSLQRGRANRRRERPLRLLEVDVVVNGGAQLSPQTGPVENSGANSSSHEDGVQSPTQDPCPWFGQEIFNGEHNAGPTQL